MITSDKSPLPPFPNRLKGMTALVTGTGSGLGEAIARRYAAEGANVVLGDIDLAAAEAVAADISANLGSNAVAFEMDVTKPEAWEAVAAMIQSRFGQWDVLVNNAGITTVGSIEELTLEALRHELDVDVVGVFLGCKAAVAAMKETGGSIINMSSGAGLRAGPDLVGYNGAKAAVTLMTKSIALHCAREQYPIRCNSIHPGMIHTAIIDKVLSQVPNPDETLAGWLETHPIGRMGHPDDIASIAAYLASAESRFATGAQFSIDGGMTAQ